MLRQKKQKSFEKLIRSLSKFVTLLSHNSLFTKHLHIFLTLLLMLPFLPHTPEKAIQTKNNDTFNWDATSFFEDLTKRNKFAQSKHFTFCRVSGLDGFEEALAKLQTKAAFVCVSDISQRFTDINNTPHTRRVKTVFLAMRHTIDNMVARVLYGCHARAVPTVHVCPNPGTHSSAAALNLYRPKNLLQRNRPLFLLRMRLRVLPNRR